MLKKNYFLITVCLLVLGTTTARAAGQVLRNSDGSIHLMTQYEASGSRRHPGDIQKPDACAESGKGHLPTIREFAKENQARGAKGILEVSQVSPDKVPAGYVKISAINSDGKRDEFYFSNEGYALPDNDLENHGAWSSSMVITTFENMGYYTYYFNSGEITHYAHHDYQLAVLCIPGR